MDKWEYLKTYYYKYDNLKITFSAWLNDYGKKGWELVAIDKAGFGDYTCIFKRKIQQENG